MANLRGDLGDSSGVISTMLFGPETRPSVKVSVIIPTFKRELLLQQAVTSALDQIGFDDFEILIIDNDPGGALPEWVAPLSKNYPNRPLYYYKNEQNLGMTGNWNRGIELSTGEWITFLHDDDWLSPYFLWRMIHQIPEGARAMGCRSDRGGLSYDRGHKFGICLHLRDIVEVAPCRIAAGNLADAPGIIYQRQAIIEAGGYSNKFYPSSDYHLNVRLVLSGGVYLLFEKLAYYRLSDSLTFKGNTLEKIYEQSADIRSLVLENDDRLVTRLLAFISTIWWAKLGIKNDYKMNRSMHDSKKIIILAKIPGIDIILRGISNIILLWK